MNLRFYKKSSFCALFLLLVVWYGCSVKPTPEPALAADTRSTKEEVEKVNTKALKHFMDGEMYFSQGNYPMAVIEFQDALRYDPGSSSIHTSLAEVYVRLSKLDRAEETLQEALRLDPLNADARELLAQKFLMQNSVEKGLEQYIILEGNNPDERQ
mgnify:FL=1